MPPLLPAPSPAPLVVPPVVTTVAPPAAALAGWATNMDTPPVVPAVTETVRGVPGVEACVPVVG